MKCQWHSCGEIEGPITSILAWNLRGRLARYWACQGCAVNFYGRLPSQYARYPGGIGPFEDRPCDGDCGTVIRHYAEHPGPSVCSDRCRLRVKRAEEREQPRDLTRHCAKCGMAFTPTRRDARTCSTRCRVALLRARRQAAVRNPVYRDLILLGWRGDMLEERAQAIFRERRAKARAARMASRRDVAG